MNGLPMPLGGAEAVNQSPSGYYDQKMAHQPTMKQRLDLAVKQAEDRLAKVKEAQEIFERNPDIERLLDIMQSAHF